MSQLRPGFADPVGEAQSVFRSVLTALSRPGRVQPVIAHILPPKPLTPELAAICLALADPDAPLWLDPTLAREAAVAAFLRFHTGAPIVADPAKAAFALVRHAHHLGDPSAFGQGSQDYPDRSTTIVLAVDTLSDEGLYRVTGPGVKAANTFAASPLPEDFVATAAANHALFPRGVDWLLAGAGRVLGLPRSSVVTHAAAREGA